MRSRTSIRPPRRRGGEILLRIIWNCGTEREISANRERLESASLEARSLASLFPQMGRKPVLILVLFLGGRETAPPHPASVCGAAVTLRIGPVFELSPRTGHNMRNAELSITRKTVFFFVSFHQGATQSGILFLVSIERGTSRRVYHRRPWLSDTSQRGSAPCRFLARPGCGTRRCCRTNGTSLRASNAWPAWRSWGRRAG